MDRVSLIAFCIAFSVVLSQGDEGEGMTPLDFGMTMSVEAYNAVCWYENLKIFPNTNTKGYNQCSGAGNHVKKEIQTQDFFKQNPGMKEEYFGKWFEKQAMGKIPKKYQSSCSKYLKDANGSPDDNESDALNDGGNTYPYRSFAYCLIHTLRQIHGPKAVDAVKEERTHSRKHWMQTLLDRDNEFRARHGVQELQLVEDLNSAAQEWAEKLASECKMYHSKNKDSFRQWNGDGTGESLAAGGGADEREVNAYRASDGWYQEIKDYPYPGGYRGDDENLFKKIGHFTQTVWKTTKYVGYGYAYNKDCSPYTFYIAARYSPAGNLEGTFPENVLPPK